MNKSLLDVLVCPGCNGKLKLTKDRTQLVCSFEKLAYSIQDDIPNMLIDNAKSLSSDEMEKLEFI